MYNQYFRPEDDKRAKNGMLKKHAVSRESFLSECLSFDESDAKQKGYTMVEIARIVAQQKTVKHYESMLGKPTKYIYIYAVLCVMRDGTKLIKVGFSYSAKSQLGKKLSNYLRQSYFKKQCDWRTIPVMIARTHSADHALHADIKIHKLNINIAGVNSRECFACTPELVAELKANIGKYVPNGLDAWFNPFLEIVPKSVCLMQLPKVVKEIRKKYDIDDEYFWRRYCYGDILGELVK
jgi:hypothetical protein